MFFFVICGYFFFQIIFFKKLFQEYHQSAKQFGSGSGPTFVGPDMGPNFLQRISADDKSCTRKEFISIYVFYKLSDSLELYTLVLLNICLTAILINMRRSCMKEI